MCEPKHLFFELRGELALRIKVLSLLGYENTNTICSIKIDRFSFLLLVN